MAADVLVRSAWYVAGLSREFPAATLLRAGNRRKAPCTMANRYRGGFVRLRRAVLSQRGCRCHRAAGSKADLLECAYPVLCYDAAEAVRPGCSRIRTAGSRTRRGCGRFRSSSRTGLILGVDRRPGQAEAVRPPHLP